jgi:sugar (pentulose or hexulose) kinase
MSRQPVLVGVDVGTTRVKAVAVDLRGSVRGEAAQPTPWRRDGGHAEVDPIALVRHAQRVAADAAGSLGEQTATVLGIGVTGMAETGVLVDGRERPLAPAIAWHDPRGDAETIARELGTETFQTTTGLPLTVLPTLAKLLWLRRTYPGTRQAVRFYSVAEWVVRRLGGAPVTELSLASRTGLLDIGRARPWDAALDLLDRPRLLDEAVIAGTPAGRVTEGEDVPPALTGAVLTVAGHDHQVAAYGVGAATDGAVFDSLGTAEALVRTVRPPLPGQRVAALAAQGISVGWGVVADHLCVLAGIPTGLTLNRIASMLGAVTAAERHVLGEQALAVPPNHPVPRLVDPREDGFGILDITDGVTPAMLWRAAADALAERAQRVLERIDALTRPHTEVVVAGGWLHNPAVLAAKRRQYPAMRTTTVTEPGAYGAALLAGAAAGVMQPVEPAATQAASPGGAQPEPGFGGGEHRQRLPA